MKEMLIGGVVVAAVGLSVFFRAGNESGND